MEAIPNNKKLIPILISSLTVVYSRIKVVYFTIIHKKTTYFEFSSELKLHKYNVYDNNLFHFFENFISRIHLIFGIPKFILVTFYLTLLNFESKIRIILTKFTRINH